MTGKPEHRSHQRLKKYWNEQRGEREFPAESDISPQSLADIWPSCFLISIDDVTHRLGYRYSYLGDDLIEAYGDDIKNPDVGPRLISTTSSAMVEKFDEVVKHRKPVIDESHFVNLKNIRIKYRACMLPLGYDSKGISHIIGCMRWKID